MTRPLEGRLALVTGASRGIGAAVARRLGDDGARVLVHYNSGRERALAVAKEIHDAGGQAEIVGANLGDRSGPAELIAQLDGVFGGSMAGRLDVLVNNAGKFEFSSLIDTTDEAFDALMALNLRAVFQLGREAARRMSGAQWGRIINIGSVFGEAAPMAGMGTYCASKFAVRGLTQAWSRDLGALGITVNNVQPALIQKEPPPTSGATHDAMKRFASVGRFGGFDEVAHAVSFLANPASGFINGVSLSVDGGWRA